MIAYCGIDCSKCEGYLATLSGKEEELIKVAQAWSEKFQTSVMPEDVICDGCKADERKSRHCKNTCEIRPCCIGKRLKACINCDNFPCADECFIIQQVPDAKKNMEIYK